MDATEYQRLAARTLIDEPDSTFTSNELAVMLAALELAAKCGAVCDYLKKGICHRHGFELPKLASMLDDLVDFALNDVIAAYNFPIGTTADRKDQMHIWNALGLCGEAGEVASLVKDIEYGPIDQEKLTKELGDSAWYMAALCTRSGIDLSDVLDKNIQKLIKRYPAGYTSADSVKRVDVHE